MGSDANFAAVRSTAPSGRAFGSANLDSDPKNPCSRQAGSRSNSLRCTSLKQSLALIRLPLRCSALPHGVGEGGSEADADTDAGVFEVRAQIRRAFVAPCGCFAAKLRSDPKNQAARRVLKCFWPVALVICAQAAIKLVASIRAQPDLEPEFHPIPQNPCECAEERSFKRIRASDCLSAASSSSTPLEASTARCPQRSGGTQTPGSPFPLLTLLLAKQKKSESPAAATERHRNSSKNRLIEKEQGFDKFNLNGVEPVQRANRSPPKINLNHPFIRLHLIERPLRQHRPVAQHRDDL